MYIPDTKILENYADILINFALGNTKGIKKGDVVYVEYYDPAKPLALEVQKAILKSGGVPLIKCIDDDFEKELLENATLEQLEYFPEEYYKGLIAQMDHRIKLLSDKDPMYLKDIDSTKIIALNQGKKMYKKWFFEKVDAGEMSWTLCSYATEAMAKEAGLSLEEYWQQIINACFLNEANPLEKWRQVDTEINEIRDRLSKIEIDKLHVQAKDTDLWISMGEGRKWLSGGGNNIPSFEIFTSPDYREVEGEIYFDYPLYRYGNIIKDIKLVLKAGKVIEATASQNEKLLKEMIAQEGADQIGEFSLTDIRFSKINKFMADTLYDENYGGQYGNTHLALGSSYHDSYTGDASNFKDEDWLRLGYNDSAEHCDIMATTPRKVTALLKSGDEIMIYENGQFVI